MAKNFYDDSSNWCFDCPACKRNKIESFKRSKLSKNSGQSNSFCNLNCILHCE